MGEKPSFESSGISFSKQVEHLEAFLKNHYPENFAQIIEVQEGLEKKRDAGEKLADLREIEDLAKIYKVELPSNTKEISPGIFSIPVGNHFWDKRLPAGYGFKGGAARALLLRALKISHTAEPRDIDIVRIAKTEPYPGADAEIASTFSPEDFRYGNGVEPLGETHDAYFASRDLTINEVYATDNEIFATKKCITDTMRFILRPTEHILRIGVEGKILSRIIGFYVEMIERYGEAEVEDIDPWVLEESFISPF